MSPLAANGLLSAPSSRQRHLHSALLGGPPTLAGGPYDGAPFLALADRVKRSEAALGGRLLRVDAEAPPCDRVAEGSLLPLGAAAAASTEAGLRLLIILRPCLSPMPRLLSPLSPLSAPFLCSCPLILSFEAVAVAAVAAVAAAAASGASSSSSSSSSRGSGGAEAGEEEEGRGGGPRGGAPPTIEGLDAQLEAYMGEDVVKQRLDRDLDAYFSATATDSAAAAAPPAPETDAGPCKPAAASPAVAAPPAAAAAAAVAAADFDCGTMGCGCCCDGGHHGGLGLVRKFVSWVVAAAITTAAIAAERAAATVAAIGAAKRRQQQKKLYVLLNAMRGIEGPRSLARGGAGFLLFVAAAAAAPAAAARGLMGLKRPQVGLPWGPPYLAVAVFVTLRGPQLAEKEGPQKVLVWGCLWMGAPSCWGGPGFPAPHTRVFWGRTGPHTWGVPFQCFLSPEDSLLFLILLFNQRAIDGSAGSCSFHQKTTCTGSGGPPVEEGLQPYGSPSPPPCSSSTHSDDPFRARETKASSSKALPAMPSLLFVCSSNSNNSSSSSSHVRRCLFVSCSSTHYSSSSSSSSNSSSSSSGSSVVCLGLCGPMCGGDPCLLLSPRWAA
ncbi:hypothetical protein ACSSS7_004164 [Eimeria intestinalis]